MTAVTLRHRFDGDADAPVLVLGASLGTTLEMWDPQVGELSKHWRVLRFDTRGHGGSAVPPGPYSMADLATDVLALADSLGIDRFAYAGLSLGGAIGQWLAVHHRDRVTALVLCCTSARFGDPQGWRDRAARVRAEGTGWLVEPSRGRWFTAAFPARDAAEAERLLAMIRAVPAEGYAGCCDALAGFDLRGELSAVVAPTRVVAGAEDPATPVAMSVELAELIPGAGLVVVPGAAHLASVEEPEAVTHAIAEHLDRCLQEVSDDHR